MFNLANYLFETNAIRFCEENKPFWYIAVAATAANRRRKNWQNWAIPTF